MFLCDTHGTQEGLSLSPDLLRAAEADDSASLNAVLVSFEYKGDITHSFLLSPSYAQAHGLEADSVLPLPDDYPEWVMNLQGICRECFIDKGGSLPPDWDD